MEVMTGWYSTLMVCWHLLLKKDGRLSHIMLTASDKEQLMSPNRSNWNQNFFFFLKRKAAVLSIR